ncbi:MAG: hypothetical protein J3R72DRAFT_449356 [Linnemannia gamsii]|nr:MAG: hypothetical protein J3R72DRAFT_449356 [Linnemannia gamsii]
MVSLFEFTLFSIRLSSLSFFFFLSFTFLTPGKSHLHSLFHSFISFPLAHSHSHSQLSVIPTPSYSLGSFFFDFLIPRKQRRFSF